MSSTDDRRVGDWTETMLEEDWSEEERTAFQVIRNARPGDEVLFAGRSMEMEVVETGQDDEGRHFIEAAKPLADGTYTVKERYRKDKPRYTSGVGRANDLRWVSRTEEPRGLSEDEYRTLVHRQSENARDAFVRLDYGNWDETVRDVVEDWGEEVAFQRWRGYKHHPDWEEGDTEAIFESVLDHSDYDRFGEAESLRTQAESALYKDAFHYGRDEAEATIIQSQADYDDIVEMLAHHSIDRFDRKSYSSARVAVLDTVSNWIDDRTAQVHEAVLEYGEDRFVQDDYDDLDPGDVTRHKAFDVLNHDVWELAQQFQRDEGNHDPTVRGLTYDGYRELVEVLGLQTARNYSDGFLRTEAKEVVADWADAVQAQRWDGHRHRVYAQGDVEDIFASAAIHAESDPTIWNPFSSDRTRKMAVQAMLPEVIGHAESVIDKNQPEAEPMPADDYISDVLEIEGFSHEDFTRAEDDAMRETAERITEAVDGSEVGWTFVDEIVEQDGVVPESTNDWLLVDYGVIREGDTLRKLGWFNRQSGDVLALVGQATAPPSDLAEVEGGVNDPYDQFHVTLVAHDEESPQYLRTDVDLGDALDYVYEFLDADQADFRVIETGEETWIQDQITDEDINTGGTFRSLIPNFGYRTGDFVTLADSKARGTVNELGFWGPQLAKMAGYAVMYWAPKWAGDRLDGVEVDPFFNAKKKKVGVNFSKEYDERGGITTETETKFTVQPKAFFKLSERYAPKFVNYGLNEGDIGKGLVQTATERIDDIQHPSTVHQQWGKAFLDEFGGSVTTFLFTLRSGQRDYESELRDQRDEAQDNLSEELRAEFAADYFRMADSDFVDSPEDLIGRATWSDLPEEVKTDYREYIEDRTDEIDTEDMKWDDLSDDTLGISGMLMRGLDAETLVKGGKFFNVTQWLSGRLNRTGGTYTADWEPPSFEEWEQERFGPGQPPGPEAEARRRARYHKEVAGSSDAPDPYDELGVDEQTRRRINEQSDMAAETDETGLGDYDFYGVPHYIEDSFEGVADRLGGIDTVTDRFDADSEPEESRE